MTYKGFRREFLGFQRDDVIHYLEEVHKQSADKETALSDKLNELIASNSDLQKEIAVLRNALSDSEERFTKQKQLSEEEDEFKAVSEATQRELRAQLALLDEQLHTKTIALEEELMQKTLEYEDLEIRNAALKLESDNISAELSAQIEMLNEALLAKTDSLNDELRSRSAVLEDEKYRNELLQTQLKEQETVMISMADKISAFESKREEIERLGEGIGQLYRVSQSNVESMFTEADEAVRLITEDADHKLAGLTLVEETLTALRQVLSESITRFNADLDTISDTLSEVKSVVATKEQSIQRHADAVESAIEATSVSEEVLQDVTTGVV